MKNSSFILLVSLLLFTYSTKAQNNIDFENGNLNGWTKVSALNANSIPLQLCCFYSPTVSSAVNYLLDPNFACSLSSPFGGNWIAKLNNFNLIGYQYSAIQNTIVVTPSNNFLKIATKYFLERSNHTCSGQPFVNIKVTDVANTFTVIDKLIMANEIPNGGSCAGGNFNYQTLGNSPYNFKDYYYTNNWDITCVDLSAYIGNTVTIQLSAAECSTGSHTGYAYFDVINPGFSPANNVFNLNNSSYTITNEPTYAFSCGSNSATAFAPLAAISNTWYGGSINGSNASSVQINSVGVYTLLSTVLMGSGCSNSSSISTVQFTVGSTAPINVTANPTVVCANSAVNVSFTGSYPSYSVGSSCSYSRYSAGSNITVYPQTSCIYSVTGITSFGCSGTKTIAITVNPLPSIAVSTNSVCLSAQNTITATGADTYTWTSGSATLSTSNPFIFTPTTSSVLIVTATNTLTGCKNSITFTTSGSSQSITIGIYNTATTCIGQTATLIASAAGSNSFTWSPSFVSNTIALNPTVTTVYTVSTSNTCGNLSNQYTLTITPLPTISISGPTLVCQNSSNTWTLSGGTNYTTSGLWYWSGPGPLYTISIYTNGVNYVVGQNAGGCTATASIAVNMLAAPSLSMNNIGPSYPLYYCGPTTVTLTASGANTYTWSTSAVSNSIVISPTVTTCYSFTATAANGCINNFNTCVYIGNTTPTLGPVAASYTACYGQNINLNQNTSQCCGVTYSIDNQSWIPTWYYPTTSGTKTIFAQNACGVNSTTFNLTVYPTPTSSIVGPDSACVGSVITLTVSGNATSYYVNVPWPPYNFTTAAANPTVLVGNGSGSFAVSGVNSNCWPFFNTSGNYFKALQVPSLILTVSSSTACSGSPVLLQALGSGPTYNWSNGPTTFTNVVSPLTTTVITVTNTGTNGCSTSLSKTLTPTATPTVTITPSSPSLCINSSMVLTANGATGYTWSTNQIANSISVSPTVNTMYSVTGTNTGNSCVNTATFNVMIIPTPTVSFLSSTYTACPNGSVVIAAIGGNTYYYPQLNVSTQTAMVNNVVSTATYSVIGYGSNGCPATAVTTVSMLPAPMLTANSNPTNVICSGKSVSITANGANTYSWSTSATTQSIVVTPPFSTTYTVIGTGVNSCTSFITIPITVNPSPTLSITGNTNIICGSGNVTLSISGASNYTWSTSSNANNIVVSPFVTTVFTATGSSANSCTNTSAFTISVSPIPTITIAGPNALCTNQPATLTALGGNTYTWVAGPQTNTYAIAPSSSGVYVVNALDVNGCAGSASKSITVNSYPNVTINTNSNNVCAYSPVILTAGGATSYTWSNSTFNSTTQVNPPSSATVYTVTGAFSWGCAVSQTISVSTIPSPTVSVSSNNNPMCIGSLATITAVGATSYSWSNFSFNYFIVTSPSVNTTYTVTGTDPNGCYDSKVITQSVTSCTSIDQLSVSEKYLIYPNPLKDQFTIKVRSSLHNAMLEIYTTLGQLLFTQKLNSETNTINMNAYTAGIYYVKIKDGKKEEVVKLIKE
jgi:hypothetical protein